MIGMRRKRLKTALVLTGGGSRAAVEVGALKVLDSHMRPDVIIGTSAGAINAAYYAGGMSPTELERIWENVTNRLVFPVNWQIMYLFGKIRSISHPYKLKRLIERTLPVKTFEECKIPLYINATDLRTGKSVFFHSGSIVDAIMASCAIAPYYPPYRINGVEYVNGGISNMIAIDEARALKCRQIIAVSTFSHRELYTQWNVLRLLSTSLDIVMLNKFYNELEIETRGFNPKHIIHINPKFPNYIHISDFRYTKALIKHGEDEARRMLRKIKI